MKKLIVFIVLFFYITTSSGAVIHFHYCKGKLSSVKLNLLSKDLCTCKKNNSKKNKKSKCCKTKSKVIKINNLHKATFTNYETYSPNKFLFNQNYFYSASIIKYLNFSITDYYPNKLFLYAELHILNCVYRI